MANICEQKQHKNDDNSIWKKTLNRNVNFSLHFGWNNRLLIKKFAINFDFNLFASGSMAHYNFITTTLHITTHFLKIAVNLIQNYNFKMSISAWKGEFLLSFYKQESSTNPGKK